MSGLKALIVLTAATTIIGIKILVDKNNIKKRQTRIEASLEKVQILGKEIQSETQKMSIVSTRTPLRKEVDMIILGEKITDRVFKSADIVSLALAKAQKESKHA